MVKGIETPSARKVGKVGCSQFGLTVFKALDAVTDAVQATIKATLALGEERKTGRGEWDATRLLMFHFWRCVAE